MPNSTKEEPDITKEFHDIVITDHGITFGQTWKDFMFLPFFRITNYFFLMLVYSSIMLSIFVLAYHPGGTTYYQYASNLSLIFDTLYLLRTILVFVHKFNRHHRQWRVYTPEPMALLILDLITLIPLTAYCNLHNQYNWYDPIDKRLGNYYSFALKLPRIVRLFQIYKSITGDLAIHPETATLVAHFFGSGMVIFSFSVCFFIIFYYKGNERSWANSVPGMSRNYESFHTPLMCFFFTGGFHFKDLLYPLNSLTTHEKVIALFVILVAFFLHNALLNANLIAIHVQLRKFKYYYESKLLDVYKLCKLLSFKEELQNSINVYYRTIWRNCDALVESPTLMKILPLQLRSEVALDLYYDAIRHTRIFKYMNVDLSKELSRLFHTEVLIPGQLLFQKDTIKEKLVYIHSGIVEIMSTENRDSPLLSFSPGTILGEYSCYLPYKSNANIRCATTCVVHIVGHREISSLLARDVSLNMILRRLMQDRITYGKRKQQKCKRLDVKISHIYWIKYRWRQLMEYSVKHTLSANNMTKYYCSRYLNLLVLSSFDELKVHSICIRGKCSFVLESHSSFRKFMEYLSLFVVILHFLLTFHKIFFIGQIDDNMFALLTIFDLSYILDIYIQAITAVRTSNLFISKPMDILMYRCKSFKFMVDVIASIPYDYLARIMKTGPYYIGLCRVPKYIKLYKILVSKNITIFNSIIKHIVIITVGACILYTITCFNNVCVKTGWIETYRQSTIENFNHNLTTSSYALALMYTSSIYLKLMIHLQQPSNNWELLIQFSVGVFGFYLISKTRAHLAANIGCKNYARYLHLSKLSALHGLIQEHPEMKEYKNEMIDYVSIQWSFCKGLTVWDIPTLMNNNSHFLRQSVKREFIVHHLRETIIFGPLPERFLSLLAERIEFHIVPEKHILQKPNEASSHLYIILDGYCTVTSTCADDAIKAKVRPTYLGKYHIFPTMGFFHGVASFLNVETYTSCKIFVIAQRHFRRAIRALPRESAILARGMAEHLKTNQNLINRHVHLPLLHYPSVPEFHEPIDKFEYEEQQLEEENVLKHISRWRKRGLNWFQTQIVNLVTNTYDPNSKFIFYYELYRCVWIIIDVAFLSISCFRYIYYSSFKYWFRLISRGLCLIDFFIRAHVCYFNDYGVMVTHPRMTSMYYLKRSFIIDLIGHLPYNHLGIFQVFYEPNQTKISLIVYLLTKPLILYRPYYFSVIARKTVAVKYHNTIIAMANIIFFFLFTAHLTIIGLLLSCHLNNDWTWECPPESWIRLLPNYKYWYKNDYLLNIMYYQVTALSKLRINPYYSYKNFVMFLIGAILIYAAHIIDMATLIGFNVFNMKHLFKFQENRRLYIKFAKKYQFPDELKDELIEHYKFKFKKIHHENSGEMIETFYPYLREQIQGGMYFPTLKASEVLSQASFVLLNTFLPYLTEKYYKMNAVILRCNDINSMIYIVKSGVLEVNIAGYSAVLGVGGTFGCLSSKGTLRMTITVCAKVHSICLLIDSKKYYDLIANDFKVRRKMAIVNYTNAEYIFGKERCTSSIEKRVDLSQFRVGNLCKYTFDNKDPRIIFYNYFMNMHFAPIVSIFAFLSMVLMGENRHLEFYWAPVDCLILVDMYMSCHIQFTDKDSGLCLTDSKELTIKYMKSLKFYVDLITLLPLYVLKFYIDTFQEGVLLINKSLRICNMILYNIESAKTRTQSNHIRFTFLLYVFFFFLEAFFFIFYIIPALKEKTIISYDRLFKGHLQAFNMLCDVGLILSPLESFVHALYRQVMILITYFLSIWMSCGFVKMVVMILYSRLEFFREVIAFKTYCRNEQVSKPVVKHCWKYLMYLYKFHGGVQFPTLISSAPNYIIEAHMTFIGKNNVYNHPLFKNAHTDFLRQIMRYLNYEFIMPGFTIVEAGDIKMRLYFVHSGKVLGITPCSIDQLYEVLKPGDAFGEIQAMRGFKFRKTYKALTPVQLIWLRKKDFAYLLQWFPATAIIMKQVLLDYLEKEY